MKHRPVISIVLALVLALGAGFVVLLYARSMEARAVAGEQAVSVLVADDTIPAGTSLAQAQADGAFTTTLVSEKLRPADSIDAVTSANADLVALADVPPGQVLLSESFGSARIATAAISVPDGELAITLQLDDPKKVGAFLRPGSQIAVFGTMTMPSADGSQEIRATRMLLDRVTVLAVGTTTAQDEESASSEDWTAPLVTVAVNQRQVEKLVHASNTGVLTMALLGQDTQLKPSVGVTDTNLFD